MLYGYFKKLVIADRFVLFTQKVFGNIGDYEELTIMIALIFSTFQLYINFSGCTDIVRGVSQIFGIELNKNFQHPLTTGIIADLAMEFNITILYEEIMEKNFNSNAGMARMVENCRDSFVYEKGDIYVRHIDKPRS